MTEDSPSKFGLAATLIALATISITVALFGAGFVPDDGSYAEQRAERAFFWFALAIAPVLHAAGLIFGVTGLFASAKKDFAIVGVVLNAIPLLFVVVTWALLIVIVILVILAGPIWR